MNVFKKIKGLSLLFHLYLLIRPIGARMSCHACHANILFFGLMVQVKDSDSEVPGSIPSRGL